MPKPTETTETATETTTETTTSPTSETNVPKVKLIDGFYYYAE